MSDREYWKGWCVLGGSVSDRRVVGDCWQGWCVRGGCASVDGVMVEW